MIKDLTEIRLGSVLWYCRAAGAKKLVKIVAITQFKLAWEVNEMGNGIEQPLEHFFPAEIDPFILEESGFDVDNSYNQGKFGYFNIKASYDYWEIDLPFHKTFRYIHELQNLYRTIEGKELEIKI